MRRSLKNAILLALFFFLSVPAFASQTVHRHLEPETVVYNALPSAAQTQFTTNENIKAVKYGSGVTLAAFTPNLSIVAGTAFVSNPSVDLRPYVGFKIVLNETTHNLTGYLKAPGTGETLTGNIFTNGDFASAEPPGTAWGRDAGWTIAAGVAAKAASGGNATLYQNLGQSGKLLKYTLDITAISGTLYGMKGSFSGSTLTWTTTGVAMTGYTTNYTGNVSLGFGMVAAGTATIDNAVVRQVLTPSITGATVVSAAGGSTFNWTSEDGSFNRQAASFTVAITRN